MTALNVGRGIAHDHHREVNAMIRLAIGLAVAAAILATM